jgi:hypothetical protein
MAIMSIQFKEEIEEQLPGTLPAIYLSALEYLCEVKIEMSVYNLIPLTVLSVSGYSLNSPKTPERF